MVGGGWPVVGEAMDGWLEPRKVEHSGWGIGQVAADAVCQCSLN